MCLLHEWQFTLIFIALRIWAWIFVRELGCACVCIYIAVVVGVVTHWNRSRNCAYIHILWCLHNSEREYWIPRYIYQNNGVKSCSYPYNCTAIVRYSVHNNTCVFIGMFLVETLILSNTHTVGLQGILHKQCMVKMYSKYTCSAWFVDERTRIKIWITTSLRIY